MNRAQAFCTLILVPVNGRVPRALVLDLTVTADANDDRIVDLRDFAALQNCFGGSMVSPPDSSCLLLDAEPLDDDIDLLDISSFIAAFHP